MTPCVLEKLGTTDILSAFQLYSLQSWNTSVYGLGIKVFVDDALPSLFVFREADCTHGSLCEVAIEAIFGHLVLGFLFHPHSVLHVRFSLQNTDFIIRVGI